MRKNVIIGIGGTGSRVIESVVHLCAMGYGPESLQIIIVDPDKGNGNLTRTKDIIVQYKKCRDALVAEKDCPMYRTDISIAAEDRHVWKIFEDAQVKLGEHLNYTNIKETDLGRFMNVLFTETELTENLDRGFRGHPSIGAVVMANPPMDDEPFLSMWKGIEDMQENDMRVFLVGSVFGGTGAAGFPTLGSLRLLKQNAKASIRDEANKSKVLLGGALVLPYFTFNYNPNTQGIEENMFVTKDDFPIATKAALKYYYDNEAKLGFDQIYFLGDSTAQNVGEFSTGSAGQKNKPHYIELMSALASFDFFNQNIDKAGSNAKKYYTSGRENAHLTWTDLPISRNQDGTPHAKFKTIFSDFLIYAYTLNTLSDAMIQKEIAPTSFKQNFEKLSTKNAEGKDPTTSANSQILKQFKDYNNFFAYWISALSDEGVDLIDRNQLTTTAITAGDEEFKFTNPRLNNCIGNLITGAANKLSINRFLVILDDINFGPDNPKIAANILINLFYKASEKFVKESLNQ